MAYSKKAIQESIDSLKANYLKQGDTVYLSLSRVSRSGMSRVIKCYIFINRNGLNSDAYPISYFVARAVDMPFVDGMQGGVRIGGAGMDMGLQLVDCLSYALFGLPVNQNSPSNTSEDSKLGLRYRWV